MYIRDARLQAIDRKIKRIRFYKTIGKIIATTILIVLLILIFSNLNTILITQYDMMNKLNDLSLQIDQEEQILDEPQENASEVKLEAHNTTSGIFTITHYCSCAICCGKSDGITATGTIATEGRTIAVDPEVIPLGSEVLIDGQVYIAEDVGGAIKGNKIDLYVTDHNTAIQRGKVERRVSYELVR